MSLHLVKLAVGVEDAGHLARLQTARLEAARREGRPPRLFHLTRNTPRRAAEVLDGGSMFWVIRGFIRVRQRILGLEEAVRDGAPACAIVLDPTLARTALEPFRPFQGWRYLDPARAPDDTPDGGPPDGGGDEIPADLAAELRGLGLL